jgi:hypothetical protein
LTSIPGINLRTAQTLWSERGGGLRAFKNGKHFASWLSLCPDHPASGGKLLSTHPKPGATRAARALRRAAQGLHHAKNEPGDFYRRVRAKLGGAAALVASARKLARIVYALLTPPNNPTAPDFTPKPKPNDRPAHLRICVPGPKPSDARSPPSRTRHDVT